MLWHTKRTIHKYEEILGITVREKFSEQGVIADGSAAFEIAKKVSNSGQAVSGEDKSIARDERKLLHG